MFKCLRVKMPGQKSFWRAKAALRRAAYIWNMDDAEREAEKERIVAAAQYTKFYNRRSDSFATGLIRRVKKRLKHKHIKYKVDDKRKHVSEIELSFKKLAFKTEIENRTEQLEAVKAALEKKCGILYCATNAGKTNIAAGIIQKAPHKRVLYVVHRIG